MSALNKKVVCFGEILWDMLPTGKVAGGAPMNVAVHLHNFGIPAEMISKAGNDTLGGALIEFLKEKGVNTQYIQRDYSHPTGTVNVNLSDRSEVIYEIVEPAAWDFIDFSESLKTLIQEADVFIFGSLCARNEQTRKTLFDLLDQAKLKIFDVNFRPPHYSQELVEELLFRSDIVKLNEDELSIIAKWNSFDDHKDSILAIKKKYKLQAVIVTKGKDGAMILDDSGLYHQKGIEVRVEDTIGSGDSFLAAFISRMLAGDKPESCLQFACATGALVATHKGATPVISESDIIKIIKTG